MKRAAKRSAASSKARVKARRRKRTRVLGGRVSADTAARSFSKLLERVLRSRETVTIERDGIPICEVAPSRAAQFTVSDFVALLRSAPKPDASYLDLLEEITRNQPLAQPSPWEC